MIEVIGVICEQYRERWSVYIGKIIYKIYKEKGSTNRTWRNSTL